MTEEIVVLGAGYAGLGAAHRLARLLAGRPARITLVSSRPDFDERIRLHQRAAGQDLPLHPLGTMLRAADVRVMIATVSSIDAASRRIRMTDGTDIGYDTLVYALGSSANMDGAPGAAEHAIAVADRSTTEHAQERIASIPDGGVLSVVGGGLTGIETAAELAAADSRLRVRLITSGRLGRWLPPAGQAHLYRSMGRLGIELHEDTRVEEVHPGQIVTDAGALATGESVWAVGFRVPRIAADAGLAVDDQGRMLVDASLRSISHPEVYGIGDAAHAPGVSSSRMSSQTALPMGLQVARIIADRATGRTARASWVRFVWINISLGRHDGVTQFSHADNTPYRFVLTGRASARFKEVITRAALVELRHPWLIPDVHGVRVP